MPMWDKIMLRKRYIIKCINELLKNKANLVHSRHRSIHNFIINLCFVLTAYCFLVVSKKVCKLDIILIFALSNKKQQEYGTYTRTNFGNYFELHK